MSRRLTARRAGMTLMELLVVIAIIAIVASILIPTIGKARMRARLTQGMNNLKQIGISLQIYADDNGENYPLWPNPTGIELTAPDGSTYSLEATYVIQWGSADPPDLRLEKIGLGVLFPEFLADEAVFEDPGSTVPMLRGALIDELSGTQQDLKVESGYFYVNGDFETEGLKGPTGLDWLGFKTTEPVAWCAQVFDPTNGIVRFAHGRIEINVLYMDGHVARMAPPEDEPDAFIVRPDAAWTVRDVLQTIKQVSGTYNQEYPP